METEAMAEDSLIHELCEETTCSICLEYFKDPVTIECGHNFCQACLTQCWGTSGTRASCPQCRETVQRKNFRPNRQLASIVGIAKKFSLYRIKGAEALGPLCERHQEPLKLFCQDDRTLICMVCDEAKEHRGHKVIPKEEAFEKYKDKGQAYLESLKTEREAIWSSQQSGEAEGQTLLEQTERERQKIMSQCKQLHQFLEELEHCLLAKLKELDDQIKDKQIVHTDKLSEEISAVDLLIKEMEEKEKQLANEFLQGLGNILQWCKKKKKKFVNRVAFPLELKQKIENFSKIHPFLDTTMNEFKETVLAGSEAKKANFSNSKTCILPTLVLSAKCSPDPFSSAVRQQNSACSRWQPYDDYKNTFEFSCWSYFMGFERINSGSCSWVMNLKDEKFWAVGVALERFRGRNMSSLTPEEGIWAVGMSNGVWYAFTSGRDYLPCPWSRKRIPARRLMSCDAKVIRVSLNHEQDSIAFFDAENLIDIIDIHTFHNASFSGQPVSSWLLAGK